MNDLTELEPAEFNKPLYNLLIKIPTEHAVRSVTRIVVGIIFKPMNLANRAYERHMEMRCTCRCNMFIGIIMITAAVTAGLGGSYSSWAAAGVTALLIFPQKNIMSSMLMRITETD